MAMRQTPITKLLIQGIILKCVHHSDKKEATFRN